jgi:hypothetical protein
VGYAVGFVEDRDGGGEGRGTGDCDARKKSAEGISGWSLASTCLFPMADWLTG